MCPEERERDGEALGEDSTFRMGLLEEDDCRPGVTD